jgi:hypothetical protein
MTRWFGSRNRKARKKTRAPQPKVVRLEVTDLESRTLLSVNPIVAENQLPGTPQSVWDVQGAGDSTIQGYAADISVNVGQTINFKINDTAKAPYHLDIYRVGYYQGNGARLVSTVPSAQTLDVVQPAAKFDPTTALVDAGNWSVTASWAVPTTATSGVYFARVTRDDTGGAFQIIFIVRNDASHSQMLFQTSDSTWEAYNTWGGYSLYQATGTTQGPGYQGAAYAVSYNRPLIDRGTTGGLGDTNQFWYDEYPMVRWLEQNGYDVSYFTDMDSDRYGSLIQNHQVFLSTGHDEYWSGNQMANVTAARDAGVNLAFFSGNEAFWKTYYANSIDGSNTPYRTLVDYKETHANAIIDPKNPNIWTGTFMDPRFSPPADGGQPQNQLTGQLFMVNRGPSDLGTPFTVPYGDSQLRFWRNTSVASLQAGQTATLGDYELGYEWDEDVDNGFRPAGLIDMSSTTQTVPQLMLDYGNTFGQGTATNSLTLYRASSGALVFGAGMVQYDWGLDGNHDAAAGTLGLNSTPVPALQQATVNLFADMNIQPGSLMPGLVTATASTDITAPTTTISAPANGASFTTGTPMTITGTATDAGGGVVAGVEVSVDGGQTWHPATGVVPGKTASWTYTWTPAVSGQVTLKARATDDSGNLEIPSAGPTVSLVFQPTSRTGLVAEYGFNDGSGTTVNDSSGNHNTGTVANTTWVPGRFGGSALSFDGQDSWVTINNSTSLTLAKGMTLEAWVNPASLSNWSAVILKERPSGLSYALYANNGAFQPPSGYVDISSTDFSAVGNSTIPLNAWSYLTATYDGAHLNVYVNGVLASSQAVSGSIISSTNALRIGGDSIWGEYFKGLIDEVRIYNRSLNQAEILSDMNTPVGGTLDSTAPTVSVTAPAAGATVTGPTTLTVNATDNVAVSRLQWLLDGQPLGTALTTAPYSLAWDSRTATNGAHTLTAKATDLAGNVGTAAAETITVNNPPSGTPPSVHITFPPTGYYTNGLVVLSSVATDPLGISSLQYQINGVNVGTALTTAPYRILWDSHSVNNGVYSLTAVATDPSGQTGTSAPVSVTVNHTPPTVVSVTPVAGTTGASTTASLTATFSESVQPGTINLTLKDPSGNQIASSVAYDDSTFTATFTHGTVALDPLTTYTATISGVTDLAGNVIAAPYSWTFTTGNAIVGATIWNASTVPGTPDAVDGNAVELGVQFRSDTAGTISGIRFYKGTGNTGTHVGHLWTSTGTLLATATFTGETASGWQQVNFATPVAISANTTYVASYYAPNGNYAADGGYFTTAVNSGPLHALASGTGTLNGVYHYGIGGGFPTSSANATNYWVDLVFNTTTQATTPPMVTAESPGANATGVAQNSVLTVTFSKAVVASSIAFTVADAAGNAVAGAVSYNSSTYTATFTPNANLATSTTYTATVSGVTDLSGNVMSPAFAWSFTTVSASVPPAVIAQTPAPGATGVAKGATISATFSKAIDDTTLSFVLKDTSGNVVPSTVSYDDESDVATLTPSAALAPTTTFTAVVSGAKDLSGNAMTGPVSWSFTTGFAVAGDTIWNPSVTPGTPAANDPNAVELGVKFRSDQAGNVTAVRFYKGTGNTGTHVGYLWTGTGTLLASVTFVGETSSGWQQATLATPAHINANTTYIVSYLAPAGHYAADSGYFASSGVDNPPLHALANGVDGGQGVYVYGTAGAFPGNSFSSTNYWVDLVFVPDTSSAPVVTGQTPASSTANAPLNSTVTATFDEAVQSSTVAFTLKDASGNAVPATVSYNSTTLTATLTPNAALAYSTTYTASISATDMNGNVMTAPTTWSFTTVANTLWGGTATPTNPSVYDGNAIEVGVKFQSSIAGYITGMSFYKGVGNNGTHVGHLWTSGGTLLATATFTGETASGWQQVLFASPVAINAGTTYVASYYAPSGGYAADGGYFASSGVTSGSLQALSNSAAGGQGVYQYGAGGGFPTQSYNATNYWVDVSFSATAADHTPPAVSAEVPAVNATGVSVAAPVTATFTKAVQASTIVFTLKDASGNAVPAAVSYNSATLTATLTPSAPLTTSVTYTASVSATDLSGNAMASPTTWSFTTSGTTSIWSATAAPATASTYDANPVELGVKFTSDVNGFITGLRFYKGPSNTGTHVAHLWTSTGILLGTATFTGETSGGWQQVSFANPIGIAANTTYVASYYAPAGGYAVTGGYFASSGMDAAPLHALSNSAAGGNGVYGYGTGGGFPTQSFNSANYWVDVFFSTSVSVSTASMSVSTVGPAANATVVPLGSSVTASFNQSVQPSSIVFTLKDPSGNTVPATVSYDSASLTATLTPSAPLSAYTVYTASVNATSLGGGSLSSPQTWSFTTVRTWVQTTATDFSAGTQNGTAVASSSGGEVQLATTNFTEDFSGSALNGSAWTTNPWVGGGGATVANSVVSVAGAEILSAQTFTNVPVEGYVNFGAASYQHFGLATDLAALTGNYWAIFSTFNTTNTLYARVNANGATTDVSLGALPSGFHLYRVQPVLGGFQFYVDGVLQATIAATFQDTTPMHLVASAAASTPPLQVDWMRQVGGVYTSKVFDATQTVSWKTVNWTANVPAGTSLVVQIRSGNTATPDGTWSAWAAATSGGAVPSPSSRYLQYRVVLVTTDPNQTPTLADALATPVLDDITFTFG